MSRTPNLSVSREVLAQIETTIGHQPPETGGLLGGDCKKELVTHYHYDDSSLGSSVTYTPNNSQLNTLLRVDWNPANIKLLGFVHSHPTGFDRLSSADIEYARDILDHNADLQRLWLPICITEASGQFSLIPYCVERSSGIWPREVVVKRGHLNIYDKDHAIESNMIDRSSDLQKMPSGGHVQMPSVKSAVFLLIVMGSIAITINHLQGLKKVSIIKKK